MAQIGLPHFLLQGDTSVIIGKITSYSQDTARINRSGSVNGIVQLSGNLALGNSHIDSLQLVGTDEDSIRVKYLVRNGNYEDGEQRTIPIYRIGTMESTGLFLPMIKDTTLALGSDTLQYPLKITLQADLIDVMMDELSYLKNYAYLCNEQLGSKLLALLLESQLMEYRGEPFNHERDVEKIIKKLVSNQNDNGSWDWWNSGGSGSWWITLHVARVLNKAERMGFRVAYDKEGAINYIEYQRTQNKANELEAIIFLLESGEKINVSEWVDSIQNSTQSTIHQRLLAQRLIQLSGGKPNMQWMDSARDETIKGNYYWGEEREHLFDNATRNTLLAYQIKESANPKDTSLIRIRSYFLERRMRHWRNTYESGMIMETLLPSLIREGRPFSKTSVTLKGDVEKVITEFPYATTLPPTGHVTLDKRGSSPVYVAAYYEWWNADPKPVSKDYSITTHWSHEGPLKAGETVQLVVDVTVKKDVEYVMIEIPIPAGCSYGNKSNGSGYRNGEIHREYEYHKTNIYCQLLRPGHYQYTIDLVPRYTGSYTLNPAVVESMYFPTQFGRNSVGRVNIMK